MPKYKKRYFIAKKKNKRIINKNTFISKTGKRIQMRSTWEVKYAYFLEENGKAFEYEPCSFRTGAGKYLPDFFLLEEKEFVEIKGRLYPKAKIKMEQFRLLYPYIPLKILFKEDLQKLKIL